MVVSVEVPLSGGGVTEGVVRVGDTVRRPMGEHSARVHALLRHLDEAGFEAPRVLGVDRSGREVLSWVEGDVPHSPLPQWAVSDDVLRGVGRLLRGLHDAVDGFECEGAEIVGHCDVSPGNVVFRDGVAVAFIDFDLARPTTRMFDVVTAARHWAPIEDPADRDFRLHGADVGRRLRMFCDAYGLADADRRGLLPAARARFERSYVAMRDRAHRDGGGWARMWDAGAGRRIRRAQDWLDLHWDELDAHLV